jgi:hypothetical protein
MKKSTRKLIVFSTLLGLFTVTSALLMALAPAPIVPAAATSLFAVDAPSNFDVIFNTRTPLTVGTWKYIYVHHSATPTGNALTLGQDTNGAGDHFIIGNGDGCEDGEIQISQRWNLQQPALPPTGSRANKQFDQCISICLVGDFDRTVPTQVQLRRLTQLVSALQGQLHVGANEVLMVDQPRAAAGIGRYFPRTVFRGQLLP